MTQLMTDSPVALDQYFVRLINSPQLSTWRHDYQASGYCQFDPFLPEEIWNQARRELEAAFDSSAQRRDLIVAQSGNTPRRLTNVGRDILREASSVIPAVFESSSLRSLLSSIVGEEVRPVPYRPEEYIASYLHQAGDVHGWHWDDYSWALVWVFKMPEPAAGGSLEYVPNVPWNIDDPAVDRWVSEGPVLTRHPGAGSAYLLKADTALHRVSPLLRPDERMIVCYTYASNADLSKAVDHDSMEQMFAETSG